MSLEVTIKAFRVNFSIGAIWGGNLGGSYNAQKAISLHFQEQQKVINAVEWLALATNILVLSNQTVYANQ